MNAHTPPIRRLSRRAALAGAAQAVVLLAAACTQLPKSAAPAASPAPSPSPTPPATPTLAAATATPATGAAAGASACATALPTVVPPTVIPYPGYVEVEPSTGLHVTAPPQTLDVETYRLVVKGKVAHELSLTYDDIRCLPKIGSKVDIVCPGYFIDTSNLAGAPLAAVLAQAGPLQGTKQVDFTGADGRRTQLTLAQAQAADNFLAYEWEGELLPRSHGFPIRLALPTNPGGAWIKWLQEIEIS